MVRNMKDSGLPWIGTIPSNWRCLRGKFVLHHLQKPTREDDGVITCFRDGEVTLRSNRREEGFTISEKEIGYQGIDVGDLVVHGMDGFAGAIGISDSRGKASPVLVVLDSAENKRFLMYYLRNLAYRDVFLALATGIRVRSCDLRWNKIADTVFTLPHIDEQNVIVTFIDNKLLEIDTAIKEAHELIDKYKAYKQSVITEAVTKGLDPQVPMKNSGVEWIAMVPKGWSKCRLKYLCEITTGNEDTKNADSDGEYPFYVRSPKIERCKRYTFDGEGILIAGDGAGAGRIFHHVFGKYAVHQRVYRLYNFKIQSSYLHYYLSSIFPNEMDKGSAQSTVPSMRLPMLLNFNILIPSSSEQQSIANYLDDKCSQIDSIIREKENLISRLQEYKKSIIFEYVTGKKEVPNG